VLESRSILSLAVAAAIGAASFKAPGVAGGLMIAIVGFANGNRLLAGLGIAALLYYVSSLLLPAGRNAAGKSRRACGERRGIACRALASAERDHAEKGIGRCVARSR